MDPLDEPDNIPEAEVISEPPLVRPLAVLKSVQPGFFEALGLTLAFGAVLFGTVLAIVFVAIIVIAARGGGNALKAPAGADPTSIEAVPSDLIEPLAWSFPAGYFAGLLFTMLMFRLLVGKGWTREVGLRRLPITPLLLSILALPGFVVLSDSIARMLYQITGMSEAAEEQSKAMAGLFGSFHWTFAVFAVGIGPGLVEELWCRGFLGRGLVSHHGWVFGIFLTSLFFGCLHMWPPPYVVVTAIMGAGLHCIYMMSRSLWVPITVHLLNNSLSVMLAIGVIPGEQIENSFQARPVLITSVAIVLLATAGLAMWSARGRVLESPHRGIMVPRMATVVHEPPNLLWTSLAVLSCGGLLALTFI